MDWLIFGSINIIIVVILFLWLSRRLHSQYNSERFMAEVQQEVNAIITELNQTTERNLQLIEDRMEQLSALTAQLDRRILMVKNQDERRSEVSGTYTQLQEQHRRVQREMAKNQPPTNRKLPATSEEPEQTPAALDIIPPNNSVSPETPNSPPEAQTANSAATSSIAAEVINLRKAQGRETMKSQVVDMSRAGIAAGLIAQHFGISLGEVELIISLQAGRE